MRRELEREMEAVDIRIADAKDVRTEADIMEDQIKDYIAHVKYTIEHPAQLLLDTTNIDLLNKWWAFAFEELPTLHDIQNRTPLKSLIFSVFSDSEVSK